MQCDDGWANMQDASVTITVPAGSYELLTARFTAKANAWDINGGTDYGALRIVMGQRELLPADQLGVYTSTIPGYNVPAALDRSIVAAPGLHTVQVQFCVSGTVGAEMDASDWHLTVEAAPVPQR
jgi:hypothetical protein